MSAQSKRTRRSRTNFARVGRKLDREVQQVIAYLNDQVVPRLRTESGRALRVAAQKLGRIADYLDESRRRAS